MTGLARPTPRVWIATFIGLVFSIGVLTGVVVERVWLGQTVVRGPGGQIRGSGPGGPGRNGGGPGRGAGAGRGGPVFGPPPQQYVADLSNEVQLTESQRADILALLEAQEGRLRTLQDEARKVFLAEQDALHDEIAALLTPDQAAAFRAWVTTRTGRGGRGQGR
jgi:hypothetical protein